MSVAPFRIVCRSAPRRLLDDGSGIAQQRAFSSLPGRSFPRSRPPRSAVSRLESLEPTNPDSKPDHRPPKARSQTQKFMREGKAAIKSVTKKADWSTPTSEVKVDETPIALPARNEVTSPRPKTLQKTPSSEDASLPWYLQSQHTISKPATPEHLLERQRIPETPTDAPSLLTPLLQYVSVDLGVDSLTLLDLRSLDPPAALGSNLIMVIGTARGEKHLHVSADRLCRWLRSNYKLHPQADGLLGRNELKIKMRRRAKRLKVLAHVGSADAPGHDDGLRTGWVCVNVSGLPSSSDAEVQRADDSFVGFGESSADTTLVLHMLTEEKREELDLEKLWTRRLEKMQRKAAEDDIQWSAVPDHSHVQQRELIG